MSGPIDVLIVGAGPAGSSLAIRLARAGVRTTILDAREFPRSKPCGDALSPGAIPLLRELGAGRGLRASGAARIDGWRLRAPNGRWFSGRFGAQGRGPTHAFALPRAELDLRLLRAAVAAGARFLPRRRVFDLLWSREAPGGGRANGPSSRRVAGVEARGPDGGVERLRARLVVGADGLRSRVARRLGGVRAGGRRRLALVGRYEGAGLGSAFRGWGEMRISAEGVLGAAPTGPERCTLALVVPLELADEVSEAPRRFFERRLRRYRAWRRVAGARPAGPLEVTGPFEQSPRHLVAPGALLTGDAAGYFDPFTGQGIYRALRLGREAAAAALTALESPAREAGALHDYAAAVRRLLGPSRRVQRWIDIVVARPPLVNPAARALARRPELAGLLVDVTGDRLPAAALIDPNRLTAALMAPRRKPRHAPEAAGRAATTAGRPRHAASLPPDVSGTAPDPSTGSRHAHA